MPNAVELLGFSLTTSMTDVRRVKPNENKNTD